MVIWTSWRVFALTSQVNDSVFCFISLTCLPSRWLGIAEMTDCCAAEEMAWADFAALQKTFASTTWACKPQSAAKSYQGWPSGAECNMNIVQVYFNTDTERHAHMIHPWDPLFSILHRLYLYYKQSDSIALHIWCSATWCFYSCPCAASADGPVCGYDLN